jgi:hypothetical protein
MSRKLALLAVLLATPAFASVRLTYQVNGNPVPVSWSANAFPIKYSVDQRIVAKLGSTDVIDRAFNDWTTIADGAVTFRDSGVVDNAKAGQDGVNTVSVTDGLFSGQNFIGLTTNWYDDSAHIKEADIQIDPGVFGGNYNVQQVVEHEVGHLLGLDHSAVLSSMMYPYVGFNGVPSLDSDDRIAIANLYPRAESNGATLQGRVFGDGGGIFAAQVVALNESGEPVASALSDSNGEFEMKGVPAGSYRLYAEPLDGPVDVRNLSGSWRYAKVTSFPTQFADGGSIRVDGPKIYGNLIVNASGSTTLNPKWVGAFDPKGSVSLNSTTVVLTPGQTVAIALAGDGFTSGMTTFDIPNRSLKRISDFTYSGNYLYATFQVAADAPPQSLTIFAKSGNESAALTGALRIAGKTRNRAVRH